VTPAARRILLDECLPRRLKRELTGFDVSDVIAEGWAGRHNGELLQLMRKAGFHVFVTVDRNLVNQQDIASTRIAVVVLHARSNRLADLKPLVPALRTAIPGAQAGAVAHIGL
jgi:hypothetical protein